MASDIRRAATIDDVAAAAGVSRAAVSKVLRDAYGVSDAMRTRVTAAMELLEYRPRVAARAMRGRSFTIGVEIPDLRNQFFPHIVDGAMARLAGTRYQVVVAPAEGQPRVGIRAIEALVDRQVDGMIAVSPRIDQQALERIARYTPLVMFGRHDESEHYDTVAGDDLAGTTAALEHLLALGHRRIAHLTLDVANASQSDPHGFRLRRFLEVMASVGDSDPLVIRTDEGQEAARAAIDRALTDGMPATAVFAAHDELAIGALRAILERGADVSVVGYDDVPIAGYPSIGLTTVRQPGVDMGARAVSLILERVDGRADAINELFPTELIVRTSTRPPR